MPNVRILDTVSCCIYFDLIAFIKIFEAAE